MFPKQVSNMVTYEFSTLEYNQIKHVKLLTINAILLFPPPYQNCVLENRFPSPALLPLFERLDCDR